ncbi:MAG: hypothetical protein LC113_05205 [Acidobacteria bacterium]|nr:hypothetical protein [Acidobacteriota bacterium]
MSEGKDIFERWQKKAAETLDEIDGKLGIKEKLESGAKVVVDTAQKSAAAVKTQAERSEIGRKAVKAVEDVAATAGDAAKTAWSVSEPLRDAAVEVGTKAGETVADIAGKATDTLGETASSLGTNAKRVTKVVGFGASLTSTMNTLVGALKNAAASAKEDPAKAAVAGASMMVGAGLGIIFTGINSHWLLNSAIPVWSVKKLADSFDGYLKRREALIEKGRLNDAERERIEFERDIAKRVGAPMLGAFAFASGAVMMTKVLNPTEVTGFPIGTILGGDPMLEGVWFFANGVVCFKTSYDFFMIALEGNDDAERVVNEIKGLLPNVSA